MSIKISVCAGHPSNSATSPRSTECSGPSRELAYSKTKEISYFLSAVIEISATNTSRIPTCKPNKQNSFRISYKLFFSF